jgi:hypothetical protein
MKDKNYHANDTYLWERYQKELLPGWDQREIDREENEPERKEDMKRD